MNPYLAFLIFTLAVLCFVGAMIFLNWLLGPRPKPTKVKLEPFECGSPPIQTQNTKRINAKYYAVAIMFLLFDIESIFFFIWAVASGNSEIAGLAFFSFVTFSVILAVTFLYVWKEGVLDWKH